jgi:hypothetical protein
MLTTLGHEVCAMKRLLALLILGTFASTVFAQQPDEQAKKDRFKFASWFGIVRMAERNYKARHGHYGDLDDLRKDHLLDALVFESDSSADTQPKSEANFVPKSTLFQVTVSEDGKHFTAEIGSCMGRGVSDNAWSMGCDSPHNPVQDVPQPRIIPLFPLPLEDGPRLLITG